jgi:hypothetical protein
MSWCGYPDGDQASVLLMNGRRKASEPPQDHREPDSVLL